MPELPLHYAPYATIANRKGRARLAKIAKRFQFLDQGFAEYFQRHDRPSSRREYLIRRVDAAKVALLKRQQLSQASTHTNTHHLHVGDLGNFCERVVKYWLGGFKPRHLEFSVTNTTVEMLMRYLQDANEVLYWKLMLDSFLKDRTNRRSFSDDLVLCVLNNVMIAVMDEKRRLVEGLQEANSDELISAAPILKGINARLSVLEEALNGETFGLEQQDMLEKLFDTPKKPPEGSTQAQDVNVAPQSNTNVGPFHIYLVIRLMHEEQEVVAYVGLLVFFLMTAMIPGSKAFHISMETKGPGKTSDADFWYLIQSSIMNILGNLTAIVPLLRGSWMSPAHTLTWAFFFVAAVCSIISVTIYPLCNPGWSSMTSFFATAFSASSVLTMALMTARHVRNDRVVSSSKTKVD